MNTDLFQSCGHCWVFQIWWHIGCSTFTASSFRVWNSSAGTPSPPLGLFIVMLPKMHLTLHSRMSDSRWVIIPSWLSRSLRSFFTLLLFPQLFVKVFSDNHFAFLHFFFFGMVLVTAYCTVLRTSIHSSSGTLSTTSNQSLEYTHTHTHTHTSIVLQAFCLAHLIPWTHTHTHPHTNTIGQQNDMWAGHRPSALLSGRSPALFLLHHTPSKLGWGGCFSLFLQSTCPVSGAGEHTGKNTL